jgi:hypothetical protein
MLLPRNMYAIHEVNDAGNEGGIDIDSLDVGVEDMNPSCTHEGLTNWRRPDMEGDSGDASIIEKAHAESVTEPNDSNLSDEEDQDDTYIGDGHVAPVDSVGEGSDDEFFV